MKGKTGVRKMAVGGALGALAAGDLRGAIGGVIPQAMLRKKLEEEALKATEAKKPAAMKRGGAVKKGKK